MTLSMTKTIFYFIVTLNFVGGLIFWFQNRGQDAIIAFMFVIIFMQIAAILEKRSA